MKGHNGEIASAVDFKRHIEALHYLLQLWPGEKSFSPSGPEALHRVPTNTLLSVPVPTHRVATGDHVSCHQAAALGQQRPTALHLDPHLSQEEETVVSRRGRGGLTRLDSPPPINRYAGDWSVCGRNLLSGQEADYDEVAGSESDAGNPLCTGYTV